MNDDPAVNSRVIRLAVLLFAAACAPAPQVSGGDVAEGGRAVDGAVPVLLPPLPTEPSQQALPEAVPETPAEFTPVLSPVGADGQELRPLQVRTWPRPVPEPAPADPDDGSNAAGPEGAEHSDESEPSQPEQPEHSQPEQPEHAEPEDTQAQPEQARPDDTVGRLAEAGPGSPLEHTHTEDGQARDRQPFEADPPTGPEPPRQEPEPLKPLPPEPENACPTDRALRSFQSADYSTWYCQATIPEPVGRPVPWPEPDPDYAHPWRAFGPASEPMNVWIGMVFTSPELQDFRATVTDIVYLDQPSVPLYDVRICVDEPQNLEYGVFGHPEGGLLRLDVDNWRPYIPCRAD